MKRYTVAVVRRKLADALDEAERGMPVIIERKGVRYRLAVEKTTQPRSAARSRIEIIDPSVANGQWGWNWSAKGLRFRGRRRS